MVFEQSYDRLQFLKLLRGDRELNQKIHDEIALSFDKQLVVDGVRVMSRLADAGEMERMADCIRNLPADLRGVVDAVCTDGKSGICLIKLHNGQRSRAQDVAMFLITAVLQDLEDNGNSYVLDDHGLVGILETRPKL